MVFTKAIQSGEVFVSESEVQEEWEKLWSRVNKKIPEKSCDPFYITKKISGLILCIIAFSIFNLFVPKRNLFSLNTQNSFILYSERSKANVIFSCYEEDIFIESHKVSINAKRQIYHRVT